MTMTPDALANLLPNVAAALIFALLGVVLFIAAFLIFDRVTPGSLWKELLEDQNTAVGILMGCVAIAIAIVIAAAVI
jgi:putative membrane protein